VKILITGAQGQVGARAVEALRHDHEVMALGRADLDITASSQLREVFENLRPDYVINAAAYTNVDRAEDEQKQAFNINYEAVKMLASTAHEYDSFFIHFSTDYVFDGKSKRLYTEDDEPNPLNIYGITKARADASIIDHCKRFAIFRVAWVYDQVSNNFPNKILKAAAERPSLDVVADQWGTPTSAEFIAEIVSQFIHKHSMRDSLIGTGIYNLVPEGMTNWHDFAQYLISGAIIRGHDLMCAPDSIRSVETSILSQKATRPLCSILDNQKLQTALGVKFASWQYYADRFLDRYKLS